MRKAVCLALCALLALGLLAGCTGEKDTLAAYHTGDEIVTYRKLDPAKTTLVVSRTGNIFIEALCEAFEAANPDVQVVLLDITGGNADSHPYLSWVANGCAPDVMLIGQGMMDSGEVKQFFENLSVSPVIANYQTEALASLAIDGQIYWLPGPSNINCMAYNKTLFAKYGWQVPDTFDQFVALCAQIKADTNGEVEAWNANAKYSNELATALTGFVYGSLFAGVENRAWYHDFVEGNATFAGHMEPLYATLRALADAGIVREENYSYSATTRGKEFQAGKIAMINVPAATYQSEEFEFGYMPYPGLKPDEGYLSVYFSAVLGVPKRERTEAERDATDRFVAFFSSEAGQQAYIGESLMVSNVRGVTLDQQQLLAGLQPAIDAGRMFELSSVDFASPGKRCAFSFGGDLLAMIRGKKTEAECVAAVDAAPYKLADAANALPETVATVAEDFTILQTSCYLADMYRSTTDAQIGLIANNLAYRGNLMRMFRGGLTAADITTLKPRSFGNDSTLVKASMTGRQLLDALNHPLGNNQTADCIYAFSGLACTVAPWNAQGERVLSVTLADGTPIDEAKLYTVAFWAGTVADEYITEITNPYEGSFEELLLAYMTANGPATPAKDGRITLKWN